MDDSSSTAAFTVSQMTLNDNNISGETEALFPLRRVHYTRTVTLVAATAAILFVICGVIGNLLTIVALWRNRKLRAHATTWFVLSLCVSDFLFCTINLPLTASRYIHEAWIFNDVLCKIFPFFFYANFGASLLNIMLIAVNRHVLISQYSSYNRVYKPVNIVLMITAVWIFSFSLLVPPLFEFWGRFGLDGPTFSCTILKKEGKSPKKFLFVFGILLPCIVIVHCYTCIFWRVRQSRRTIATHINEGLNVNGAARKGVTQSTTPAQRREDLRLTRMMLLIFCCFLLCFLPLMIFNVMDDEVNHPTLHVVASILAWASAVINPFIYAVSNRQYRQAYANLCCFQRKSPSPHGVGRAPSTSGRHCYVTEMTQVGHT